MKKTKILVSLLVCILLVTVLVSCGRESGITVSALAEKLSGGDWVFTPTGSDNDSTYSHDVDSVVTISYSCKATKNGNVYSVTIRNDDVDTDCLKDKAGILSVISKSSMQMTAADIKAGYCITEVMMLQELFGMMPGNTKVDSQYCEKIAELFNGKSVSGNDWTISASVYGSAVTINAKYVG